MATDYGTDLSCRQRAQTLEMPDGSFRLFNGVDIALDQAEVSGRPCLAEALVRRLVTFRSTLIDVVVPSTTANYGSDVTQNVNDDMDPRDIAMAGASVDAELRKDERVVSSTTVPSFVGDLLMLPASVIDGAGSFKLVLAVSQVTVQILSVPV